MTKSFPQTRFEHGYSDYCSQPSRLDSILCSHCELPPLRLAPFQLVAYPLGVGWAKVMPSRTCKTFGVQWSLNPGPFNLKEHGLIVIMANAAIGNGVGYFTDTIVAQRGFYGQDFGWGFNIMLAFTTQVSTSVRKLVSASVPNFREEILKTQILNSRCSLVRWFRNRWSHAQISRRTRIHDMASNSRKYLIYLRPLRSQ